MKKFLALVALPMAILTGVAPVHAASMITLTEPAHRLMDGTFLDDGLAAELAPSGKLGALIFPPTYSYASGRTWYIDPALIGEVQAMTVPYKLLDGTQGTGQDVALAWLSRLHGDLVGATVMPIVDGNPSEYWVKRFIPHDRNYLLQNAQLTLSNELGQNVSTISQYLSTRYFLLTKGEIEAIAQTTVALQKYGMYMSPDETALFRTSLQKIMNPDLSVNSRSFLARDLATHTTALQNTIHLVAGKFTITSSRQNLPVTIVNGFDKAAKVNLLIGSTNQRILASDQKNIEVGAKSKVQVMVPVRVVASGSTGLDIRLITSSGVQLQPDLIYPVSVTVISPIATWITTGAALVLFFAALTRSFKRLRRKNFHGEPS